MASLFQNSCYVWVQGFKENNKHLIINQDSLRHVRGEAQTKQKFQQNRHEGEYPCGKQYIHFCEAGYSYVGHGKKMC